MLTPIKLNPVFKEIIWGGNRLKTEFNKNSNLENIAESWELTVRPDGMNTIVGGEFDGKTMAEYIEIMGENVISKERQDFFPLLIKFIDACDNLSVQVHPDDDYGLKNANSLGKTEMWYVLSAEKNAKIYVGLKSTTTRQKFLEHLNTAEMENDIQSFDSIPGDAYFIKAGRPHMIGAGNLLLEIQQNSDTTYRVYDWNRLGPDGKPRELHLEQAVACTDFMDRTVARISGVSGDAAHNRKYPIINRCQFFHCEDLKLVSEWRSTTAGQPGSFHILTAVNAPFEVGNEKFQTAVQPGSSVLIPACFGEYIVKVAEGTTTSIVRTTL